MLSHASLRPVQALLQLSAIAKLYAIADLLSYQKVFILTGSVRNERSIYVIAINNISSYQNKNK